MLIYRVTAIVLLVIEICSAQVETPNGIRTKESNAAARDPAFGDTVAGESQANILAEWIGQDPSEGNNSHDSSHPAERVSIFVRLDPLTDHYHRPGIRAFAASRGAHVQFEYDILPNVINIRHFPRAELPALSHLPGVMKVEEDGEVHAMSMENLPLIRGLQSQITDAGFSATGAGIRICIVDSGIDSNSVMYSTRIDAAAGFDFVNNDPDPEDDNLHGSHVAGIAAGGTGNLTNGCMGIQSTQGVAPGATIIGVKVLDAGGSGSYSNVIAGVNWCASPLLPNGPADVINLSLGGGQFDGTCDSDTLAQACNNAVDAGVVVVASAGNDGFVNATSTPACGSKVIAVAAVYDNDYPNCDFPNQSSYSWGNCMDDHPSVDQLCCFSNRSTKIDVAAPGCIIFSDDSRVADGTGLIGVCGTSEAAPHVAGLSALLLSENPALGPAQILADIRAGAIDLGAPGFDTSYGFGRIDVINSLMMAKPDPRDCNSNGIDDLDDIKTGFSQDCNANSIPDECEILYNGGAPGGPYYCLQDCDPDCNRSGIPDACELSGQDCNANNIPDSCDIATGFDPDCQHNGIPDSCDIGSGISLDVAPADGIPDECVFMPSALADSTGINKTRYISIQIPNSATAAAADTALQVNLVSLMHPDPPNLSQYASPNFAAYQGQVRWIGPVSDCPESESPPSTYKCAMLQCVPSYNDWAGSLGGQTLHVAGIEVIPSSAYDVRQFAASCQGHEDTCTAVSSALHVTTGRWGDVLAPFQSPSPAALTQPNISDVSAVVDKFKAVPTAIMAARCDVNPAIPNHLVDIADVANIVDAFKNLAYPFPGPTTCP